MGRPRGGVSPGRTGGHGGGGSVGGASATRVAQSVKFARETWPLLHALLPHLGQAACWAGADASQQEMSGGHVSLRELLLTAGMAGAGSALGARSIPVARAFFGRQTAEQMLTEGVDLEAHEGDGLGHTLLKHVNVTDADLEARLPTVKRGNVSRFTDRAIAEAAITDALRREA